MSASNLATNPEALLRQARTGSDLALAALLEYYRPYLRLLARLRRRRQLQAKYDDSDLVQETLLQVHRDLAQFRGVTEIEFAAWLRRIMATVHGKHVRHYAVQKRDVSVERQLEEEFANSSQMVGQMIVSPVASPSQQAVNRERAVVLSQALMQLAPDYREALILHRFEGLTMSEAAKRMDRTEDSLQKLLARGLVQLQRLMESFV
jgi:RNA polymerase sigma-70 factor (ECF subfamily)